QLQDTPDRVLRQQLAQQWIPLQEAVRAFGCSRQELQHHLGQRGCEFRASRRSNRYLYRRGDLEALYQDLYPQQLTLPLPAD
ncbi:MAG TPA: hypothetical protein IGR64_12050, partial [Leptolyngbyaceae cyanobacterium M65_K2018_010]|nr:hypothetical protein [Leptolyngbyaceae cyanobacterium M65_K2018_010]